MTTIRLNEREYSIKAKIARGGQGIIWEAENGGSKPVVLKELYGIIAGEEADPEVSDVRKQVQILEQLQGVVGIPSLIDAGFANDGRFYVAMNHVPGKTLEEHVKDGKRYTQTEAQTMLQQLLRTLNECHTRGLIHRDVKPDNIKVYEDQAIFVDVSSFGDALAKTQTLAIGTLGYVAPEQKELRTVPASDIYGLGKTMYHILTREDVSAFAEVKSVDFDGIRAVYSAGFGNILEKMCQPELEKRYNSVAAVLHDLEVGDVTETFALVKGEKNVGGINRSRASRAWDWLRYVHSNTIGTDTVSRKLWGAGPKYVIRDAQGNFLYDCLEMPISQIHYARNTAVVNGEPHLLVHLETGEQILLGRTGGPFGRPLGQYGLLNDIEVRLDENGKKAQRFTDATGQDWLAVIKEKEGKLHCSYQLMNNEGKLWGGEDAVFHGKVLRRYVYDGKEVLVEAASSSGNTIPVVAEDRVLFEAAEIEGVRNIGGKDWFSVDIIQGDKKRKGLARVEEEKIRYFGNSCFDFLSINQAVADSSGTIYIPVTEEYKIQMVNEKGERFGRKVQGGSRAGSSQESGIKLKASFETWNGKEYVHYHWDGTINYNDPFIAHTYAARDGSLLGGDGDWSHVQFLNGPQEQYAVCEKYKRHTRIPEIITVINENNALLFGGAHTSWQWYSPEGGLEAMCLTNKGGGDGIERDKVTIKDKEGNMLYTNRIEELAPHSVQIQRVDMQAVVIDNYVIRRVLMGYDQNRMGAAHTSRTNSSELRTQDGAIVCFDPQGDIQSFGKTADGKLSVFYSNGKSEVIDVLEKMKTPLYWVGKEGSHWNLNGNN